MPLQLSPEQVRRLVERMHQKRDAADKTDDGHEDDDAYDATGLPGLVTTLTPAQRHRHTVYLLFLEGADAEPGMSWGAWTLDALVQACQPEPSMTHAELFVPPEDAEQDVHFSTYLGKHANWGSAFGAGHSFYLGTNKDLWVAVPVMCMDAAPRLRREVEAHVGTDYGTCRRFLYNYAFAVPPLRSVSGWVDDRTKEAPAHCALLTARCLRTGLAEAAPPNPSAWYGPSSLYLEMTAKERFERYAAQRSELQHTRSLPEEEAVVDAANVLVWGADTAVAELDDDTCAEAIEHLCDRAVEAGCYGDVRKQRETQRHLALGLVRWSQLKRETVKAIKRAQEKAALERAAAQAAADPDALSNADTERAAGGGDSGVHASGGESSGSEGAVAEWMPLSFGDSQPRRRNRNALAWAR